MSVCVCVAVKSTNTVAKADYHLFPASPSSGNGSEANSTGTLKSLAEQVVATIGGDLAVENESTKRGRF